MIKHKNYAKLPAAVLLVCLLSLVSVAQERTLPEEDWYGDVKRALRVHYVGKMVRVNLQIPATRSGLEILDGAIQRSTTRAAEYIAEPGDELIIKSFKVTDNEIEVVLGKDEPEEKKRFPNPFSIQRVPRISLKFSRELSARDLTIENINRYLALVVDTNKLNPPGSVDNAQNAASGSDEKLGGVEGAIDEIHPSLTIVAKLSALDPSLAELTIDVPAGESRIYIDGAYSGLSPRTLRISAGYHTILIVCDGYQTWERKLNIPGAVASVLRPDLQKRN